MIPVTLSPGKRMRFTGVKVVAEDGITPAKLDLTDHPPQFGNESGDAIGLVENLHEETDGDGNVGHVFDVVVKRGPTSGASVIILNGDRDPDAGEVSEIKETFNVTATETLAAAFAFGTGVEEDDV